jgi:hypothetical protein
MLHERHSHDNDEYSSGDVAVLYAELAEVLDNEGIPVSSYYGRIMLEPGGSFFIYRFEERYVLHCSIYNGSRQYKLDIPHDTPYVSRVCAYESGISYIARQWRNI